MKNVGLILMAIVSLVGCATGTQYGYSRGPGSGRMIQYADPTLPVNSGVVANAGINGPSGPYAAALGLGSISDSSARQDARDAMGEISRNSYGYGAYGVGGRMTSSGFDNRPAMMMRGVVTNMSSFTRYVSVDGCQPVMIPAKGYAWFGARPGNATIEIYGAKDGDYTNQAPVRTLTKMINEVRDDSICSIPTGGRVQCDWFFVF